MQLVAQLMLRAAAAIGLSRAGGMKVCQKDRPDPVKIISL